MLCVACSNSDETVEFDSVRDFIAHEKGGHVSRPEKPLPPSPKKGLSKTEMAAGLVTPPIPLTKAIDPVLPKPVPLELKYKWMGVHDKCNTEVKTIEVDLGSKAMIIAYCINCDLKLLQKEVIPIKLQDVEFVPGGLRDVPGNSIDVKDFTRVFEKNVRPKK